MTSEPQSHRCRLCKTIKFEHYLEKPIPQPIHLGVSFTVRSRARYGCPFCKLVVHVLDAYVSRSRTTHIGKVFLRNELSWKLAIEKSPYDLSKSVSYSNKYDLRSAAKQHHRAVYRFVVSAIDVIQGHETWKVNERDVGTIQYLAHKEKNPDDRQFYGRKVDANTINVPLMESWLSTCVKWHTKLCNDDTCQKNHLARERPTEPLSDPTESRSPREDTQHHPCERDIRTVENLPVNLRLIDVKHRCIIKLSSGNVPEYVALTYVWGKDEMVEQTGLQPVTLSRCEIRKDTTGLERTPLPKVLPQTIEDALTLTSQLGFRYLWVDALCIIQDSPWLVKSKDLTSMKLIYSSSSLTIAAAAGKHANHGIPGVSIPRAFHQYSQLVDGLRLATMFPTFTELDGSSALLWNTRGWTFQEKLLSKRLLLFTDYQVYFKCSESIWSEEIHTTTTRLSKSLESRTAKYLWDPDRQRPKLMQATKNSIWFGLNPRLNVVDEWGYLGGFMDYAAAVKEFTSRSLTDPKDTLSAISGILETLEGAIGQFTLGLPDEHFLESLLWQPSIGSHVQRNKVAEWPTWTWASWKISQGTC